MIQKHISLGISVHNNTNLKNNKFCNIQCATMPKWLKNVHTGKVEYI